MPSFTKKNFDRLNRACVFASALICLCLLTGATPAGAADAPVDKPLQGGVDESWIPTDRVPLNEWKNNVAPRLREGLKWSDSLLPQQNTEIVWLHIPTWLAGQWHTESASFISSSGGKIGESAAYLSRHNDSFGCQRDRAGGIWHLMRFPTVSSTLADGAISYFIDFTMSGNSKNAFHINFDVDDVEVVVNKSDQHIQSVRKRHDATSWIKIGPNVSADDLMTINGATSKNGTIRSQPNLVSPFKRVDGLADGYDVKSSLNHFLVTNGNADLVPISSEKKSTE